LALAAAALTLSLLAGYWASNVSTVVTAHDRAAIAIILNLPSGALPAKAATFDAEVSQIKSVQEAVLKTAPIPIGIPKGASREPMDLIRARAGSCYDRSRAIEKGLSAIGYRVRHVFIVSRREVHNPLLATLTPNVSSHALTEVLTRRGWMVADSNQVWVGLAESGEPLTVGWYEHHRAPIDAHPGSANTPLIIIDPFVRYYGVYSRHGAFFPPYNVIPDINWPTFMANFLPYSPAAAAALE